MAFCVNWKETSSVKKAKVVHAHVMIRKFQPFSGTSRQWRYKLNVPFNCPIRWWIKILESLYYCFTIQPWSRNVTRSLLKKPKVYLWDRSLLSDPGTKSENFVASHLLKAIHWWTDNGFGDYGLYFLRDKAKREVDFLATRNKDPWFLIEVNGDRNKSLSKSLVYFQKQVRCYHTLFKLPFQWNMLILIAFRQISRQLSLLRLYYLNWFKNNSLILILLHFQTG